MYFRLYHLIIFTLLISLIPGTSSYAKSLRQENFRIQVFGVGGHGAYPHTAKDPFLLAAQIVSFFTDGQSVLPSRSTNSASLHFHTLNGGTKRNIIPEVVVIEGEITFKRSRNKRRLLRALQKTCSALGKAAGLQTDRLPRVEVITSLKSISLQKEIKENGSKNGPSAWALLGVQTGTNELPGIQAKGKWKQIVSATNEIYPRLEAVYRDLHSHPELSFQEKRTSAIVAKNLVASGYEVTNGVGGHNVVGLLRNGPGPVIMIRGDMDALPIEEKTGAPYASRVRGKLEDGREVFVMHACGHDIHTTCLIGAAELLAKFRKRWSGTLVVVGQGAEERGAGAKALLKAGLFERWPRPDFCLAQHCDATLEAGKVGIKDGFYNAGINSVNLRFRGRKRKGPNPLLQAMRCLIGLQSIVSRELNPSADAVVTVGRVVTTQGKRDSSEVLLEFTIRTREKKVRDHILLAIKRIVTNIAATAGGRGTWAPIIDIKPRYLPSTCNDSETMKRIKESMITILGIDNVTPGHATMGGDDFGFYANAKPRIPVCYYRIGAASPMLLSRNTDTKKLPGLHNPRFLPEAQRCIRTGVLAMTGAVLALADPACRNAKE